MSEFYVQPVIIILLSIVAYFAYLFINTENEVLRKIFFLLSILFLDINVWFGYVISLSIADTAIRTGLMAVGFGLGIVALLLIWFLCLGLWQDIMAYWEGRRAKEDFK